MNRYNNLRATCCIALLAPFFLLIAAPAAQADIYRYEDEAGRVVYTNVPPRSKTNRSVRVVTEQISVIPGMRSSALLPAPTEAGSRKNPAAHRASTPESLAGVPSQIDSETQQNRDTTRRGILLDELNAEVKALSEAKKQLQTTQQPAKTAASQPTFPSQTASANTADISEAPLPLQQTIQSHERNINALQKELGRR